jgi:hypothetical protein
MAQIQLHSKYLTKTLNVLIYSSSSIGRKICPAKLEQLQAVRRLSRLPSRLGRGRVTFTKPHMSGIDPRMHCPPKTNSRETAGRLQHTFIISTKSGEFTHDLSDPFCGQ